MTWYPTMRSTQGAALLSAVVLALFLVMSVSTVRAQDANAATSGTPLDVAAVGSPDINCLFAVTCIWYVDWDFLGTVPLEGTNGDGWLQTRLTRRGEAGTVAEGLYPYLYGFNFYELAITAPPAECIEGLTLPVGEITPVDYDEDGEPDDLFVIQADAGYLSEAVRLPTGEISVTYNTPICPGSPATENGSLFFGLASTQPFMPLDADIHASGGSNYSVNTLVPAATVVRLPMIVNQ